MYYFTRGNTNCFKLFLVQDIKTHAQDNNGLFLIICATGDTIWAHNDIGTKSFEGICGT
jgi:hypothetical protein